MKKIPMLPIKDPVTGKKIDWVKQYKKIMLPQGWRRLEHVNNSILWVNNDIDEAIGVRNDITHDWVVVHSIYEAHTHIVSCSIVKAHSATRQKAIRIALTLMKELSEEYYND